MKILVGSGKVRIFARSKICDKVKISNKESVNILTSLLVEHGVRHAVVCPGSRNAPIVHNLNECPHIDCFPVTDERSAGFFALGMAQALDEPVVVCVTSGSALLNLAPAVAEAHYQHQSLVIVSADRPTAWIDQLDGQTLSQPGALEPWVGKSVSLPEVEAGVSPSEARWHCNRLVNEALLEAWRDHRPCVHINVPLSEPLFVFSVEALPCERAIRRFVPPADYDCLCSELTDDFLQAERPMVVFGQMCPYRFSRDAADYLFSHVIVLHEALSSFPSVSHFDEVLAWNEGKPSAIAHPDFVLYVGNAIVSKRLKAFLRKAADAKVWRVSVTGEVEDTFQNLRGIIVGDAEFTLTALSRKLSNRHGSQGMDYRRQWLHLLEEADARAQSYAPAFSQMATVKYFEQQWSATFPQTAPQPPVHYANSTPIRLANIYARHHVWCNRGVNGIEGSLSTAVGFSVVMARQAMRQPLFCVIGDLSFFYDQNALWNQNLQGNLRILLLNNGQGGIFRQLKGLEESPSLSRFVAGSHHANAEGICHQNGIDYLAAGDMEEMEKGIDWLMCPESTRPMLLEVFTDAIADAQAYRKYFNLNYSWS